MKYRLNKRNLILGSLTIACTGMIIMTVSSHIHMDLGSKKTDNNYVKDNEDENKDIVVNDNLVIKDTLDVPNFEDILNGDGKDSAEDKDSINNQENAENSDTDVNDDIKEDFTAGKVELALGNAGAFSQFIENNVTGDKLSDSVNATIEAVDVVTKLEPEEIVSIISGYKVLGVSDTGSTYLNVRKGPGTKYKRVGTMPSFSACEILETTDNGWYKIKSGDVEGYVAAKYIITGEEANEVAKEKMETVAIVNCKVLNVRQEPNTNCTVFTSVKKGEEVEIVEDLGDWLKININNLEGYVYAEYIDYVTKLPTAIELQEIVVNNNSGSSSGSNSSNKKPSSKDFASGDQTVSQKAKDLVDYALQFLGNPYVLGGNSLTKGTDCSGFTKLIFAHFGYNLSRIPKGQVSAGKKVALADVKPGDLLFYKYNGQIGHVAIYIGSGKIVHASTPKGGIRISNALYTTPACAVRVIE